MTQACMSKHVCEDLVGPEVFMVYWPQPKYALQPILLKPFKIKLISEQKLCCQEKKHINKDEILNYWRKAVRPGESKTHSVKLSYERKREKGIMVGHCFSFNCATFSIWWV